LTNIGRSEKVTTGERLAENPGHYQSKLHTRVLVVVIAGFEVHNGSGKVGGAENRGQI